MALQDVLLPTMLAIRGSRWALGQAMLASVVVLWVVSGFLINGIGHDYNKPYLITYLNTALMAFYLPASLGSKQTSKDHTITKFNKRETAVLAMQFSLVWFVSNLLSNISYFYTTVQSATILSSTSSFFTLILGAIFKTERFTLPKMGAILLAIGGVWLVTYEDERTIAAPDHTNVGNICAIAGAFCYGIYCTMLKYKVGSEDAIDTRLFMGFVGLFVSLTLWPTIIAAHFLGLEEFELPPAINIYILLALNGIVTFVSDCCWVVAMLLTSPLLVTVGLSATIPLSMLGELILHHRVASPVYFIGTGCVLWSFLFINKQEHEDILENDNLSEALSFDEVQPLSP